MNSHSPAMQSVLGLLKRRDRLFDYNVPALMRTQPDERLIEHLRSVYAQPEFVIEEPAELHKYSVERDRVIKRGDYRDDPRLVTGALGTLRSFGSEDSEVVFEKYGTQKVPTALLVSVMQRGRWWEADTELSEHPIAQLPNAQRERLVVKYMGPQLEGKVHVPDGATGIIASKIDDTYRVVWEYDCVPQQTYWFNLQEKRMRYFDPPLKAPDLRLVVRNRIKLDDILAAATNGDLGELARR